MRSDGYTLIEILIVLAFLAIILLIATPLTLQNIRRAKAENQVQTIYSNIAEARQRSVQRNLNYLIEVSEGFVNVYEDRNNDGAADAAEKLDQLSTIAKLSYKLQGMVGSDVIDTTARIAVAGRRGFIQPNILIFLDKSGPGHAATGVQESRHNCISIDFTRVSVGKYNGSICQFQ